MMEAVRAYYDGRVFIPTEPVKAKKNQNALITILEEEKKEKKPHLRFIGILSAESYNEICTALKDTQEIDTNEW